MINSIIESSPAMPLVLPTTPIPERDTDPTLPSLPVALRSPQFFIRSNGHVYSLETAPVEAFNGWVLAVIAAEQLDDPLALFIIKEHAKHGWDDLARLWLIINLQVRGIDIAKYAYANREAAEKVVVA